MQCAQVRTSNVRLRPRHRVPLRDCEVAHVLGVRVWCVVLAELLLQEQKHLTRHMFHVFEFHILLHCYNDS